MSALQPFAHILVFYLGNTSRSQVMQKIRTGGATGDHTAAKLNVLISGEMAIVGMYTEALKNIDNCSCASDLAAAKACHQNRAEVLAGAVGRLGARPYQASPAWRAFACVIANDVSPLNEHQTIATLVNTEAKISEQYSKWMRDNAFVVQLLAKRLNSRQRATEASMYRLQSRLKDIKLAA